MYQASEAILIAGTGRIARGVAVATGDDHVEQQEVRRVLDDTGERRLAVCDSARAKASLLQQKLQREHDHAYHTRSIGRITCATVRLECLGRYWFLDLDDARETHNWYRCSWGGDVVRNLGYLSVSGLGMSVQAAQGLHFAMEDVPPE
jgi:hypothetical protein